MLMTWVILCRLPEKGGKKDRENCMYSRWDGREEKQWIVKEKENGSAETVEILICLLSPQQL